MQETTAIPTIKGIFVKSHINAVRQAKSEAGLMELRRRYGQSIELRNNDNIPIPDEVKIINLAFDIVSDHRLPTEMDFEAGRFHFRNFLKTPLAKYIFSAFRNKFKLLMLNAKNIAGHVFQGMIFTTIDLGPSAVKVRTENNYYPPNHFRGLLYEWLHFSVLQGSVEELQAGPRVFEYTIRW